MLLDQTALNIPADISVAIRAPDDLSDYERWQVRNWQAQTFALSETFATVDWYIFGVRDDQWVSMLEIAERVATVDQHPVALALIGSVGTVPQWRGHGYAPALLRQATSCLCHQRGLAFGLLLCMEQVVPFYERCGWQRVVAPLFYDQPSGKSQSDQHTMVYSCPNHTWPQGTIDLCGLPL